MAKNLFVTVSHLYKLPTSGFSKWFSVSALTFLCGWIQPCYSSIRLNKSKYFDGIVPLISNFMNNHKYLGSWGHSRVVITTVNICQVFRIVLLSCVRCHRMVPQTVALWTTNFLFMFCSWEINNTMWSTKDWWGHIFTSVRINYHWFRSECDI